MLPLERVKILKAKNQEGAIDEMVDLLATAPEVKDGEELRRAILERERTMSTGIGLGIAIPHARIASVTEFVIAFGKCPDGIDYDSLDGKPVYYVFLIAGPEHAQQQYLQILAKITLKMKNEQFRQRIMRTNDPQQIHDILIERLE
jgi:fructose-specific phosphotransferase system IIA component